jgi:hypothetical protein
MRASPSTTPILLRELAECRLLWHQTDMPGQADNVCSCSKRRGRTPRRPTRKQPKASLPALEWLAAKRYKKVCLGHKKCRPEEWRLTVVPQFRLRCSAMVAITKRGSP